MAYAARCTGLTLIELLVALAIGAVLLTVAVPGYAHWIAAYQLRNQAEQLASSLSLARSEAVKRGQRVNLCPAPAGARCVTGGNWCAGWVVHVDPDRDGAIGDAEPILRVERPGVAAVRITANRPLADYVSFTPLGHARLVNGALQMGTFTVCRAGLPATKVIVANSGRVRVERTAELCG